MEERAALQDKLARVLPNQYQDLLRRLKIQPNAIDLPQLDIGRLGAAGAHRFLRFLESRSDYKAKLKKVPEALAAIQEAADQASEGTGASQERPSRSPEDSGPLASNEPGASAGTIDDQPTPRRAQGIGSQGHDEVGGATQVAPAGDGERETKWESIASPSQVEIGGPGVGQALRFVQEPGSNAVRWQIARRLARGLAEQTALIAGPALTCWRDGPWFKLTILPGVLDSADPGRGRLTVLSFQILESTKGSQLRLVDQSVAQAKAWSPQASKSSARGSKGTISTVPDVMCSGRRSWSA